MLIRLCAGGIVFCNVGGVDNVFLLQNDKLDWAFPKGVLRQGRNIGIEELAKERVYTECGVTAEVLCPAGQTSYEFYSTSRKKPVENRISWYVMIAREEKFKIAFEQGFRDGGWYDLSRAVDLVTYSKDKELLKSAYDKYLKITGG